MLPTFLCIGAPRCGTTALHYALEQHPQIFVSQNKEPNALLFTDEGEPIEGVAADVINRMRHRSVRTRSDYEALFQAATSRHRAIGEASTAYIQFAPVADRIHTLLPDVKIVAVLRHPVEQALSLFTVRLAGQVPEGDAFIEAFVDTLATDRAETSGYGVALAEYGRFGHHLRPYYERFGAESIHIILNEDLDNEPGRVFDKLFAFLSVDRSFQPDLSRRLNESGAAQSGLVHYMITRNQRMKKFARQYFPEAITRRLRHLEHQLRSANLRRTSNLPADLRHDLTERYYEDDITHLMTMTGRNLEHWLH